MVLYYNTQAYRLKINQRKLSEDGESPRKGATGIAISGKAALEIEGTFRRPDRGKRAEARREPSWRGEWSTATANLSRGAKAARKDDNQDASDITG